MPGRGRMGWALLAGAVLLATARGPDAQPAYSVVGSFSTVSYGSSHPFGIALDPGSGELLVTDAGGGGSLDRVFRVTRAGVLVGVIDSAAYGGTDPTGVAVAAGGTDLWISDSVLDTVFHTSAMGGLISSFFTGPAGFNTLPAGLVQEVGTGNLYVVDGGGSADELFVYDSFGVRLTSYDLTPQGLGDLGVFGITLDAASGHLLVVDSSTGLLHEMTPAATVLSSFDLTTLGVIQPLDVTWEPGTGHLFLVDGGADLVLELAAGCAGTCGDCDRNGLGPDVLDALAGAQIAAAIFAPTPEQARCCDVNADALITVIDALLMAQSAASLPVTLTCP